jgi:hypothetical protein
MKILITISIILFSFIAGAKPAMITSLDNIVNHPAVSVWNYDHMVLVRESLKKGERTYLASYKKLIREAEQMLGERATSVTDKPENKVAKSGDKHDFISVSKYCWPNPNTPDGMPWVYIDGVVNVENFSKDDAVRQDKMCGNVTKLSLAYFFSSNERFAAKAVELARVWFVDPATRMNPHLLYAQVIPGTDNDMGHPPGIIFGRIYVNLLAGLSLIRNSPKYNQDFDLGIKRWFSEYSNWLTTSEAGIAVDKMTNNHSIAYDQQLLAIALFLGDETAAKQIISDFHHKRIFPQVEPDGKMPRELSRNRALGYSAFNVFHMLEICEMGKTINPDLYQITSADGRSISKAIEFVAQFPGKKLEDFAPYKQIADWDKSIDEVCWILKWADKYEPSKGYGEVFNKHEAEPDDHANHLLY